MKRYEKVLKKIGKCDFPLQLASLYLFYNNYKFSFICIYKDFEKTFYINISKTSIVVKKYNISSHNPY